MNSQSFRLTVSLFAILLFAGQAIGQTSGALVNGTTSRTAALGGATVASTTSPLEAMQNNPAGLAELNGRTLDISFVSLFTTGNFTNSVSNDGTIRPFAGALPFGAFAMPLGHSGRVKVGFSVAPDTMISADWKYMDPPGGLGGASYGLQRNKSAILGLRYAGGVGVVVNKKLSIGGTVGAIYNRNTLQAPYIFQEQPTLAGAKVLLDLHTSGTGWNGSFGALYTPTSKVKVGVSYKTTTTVHSHGDASGNAQAQWDALGAPFQPDYHYDAEVVTKFPQAVSAGVSWQAHKRMRLNLQGNWVNWQNSFNRLPVFLTNGTNPDINSLVGSDAVNDVIPVEWKNQGVFGVGVESPMGEHLAFRGGYSYATNPVPSSTLTPMTAAILQNTLGTGFGYSRGRCNLDFAYQVQLPAMQSVGTSGLLSGEYDNSKVHVAVHSLTVSTRFHF